jgi:hypothetical protein
MNAGYAHCPVCDKVWLVTPHDDCMMPACGCFGRDTSFMNYWRVCENCGIDHAMKCDKMPQANESADR